MTITALVWRILLDGQVAPGMVGAQRDELTLPEPDRRVTRVSPMRIQASS